MTHGAIVIDKPEGPTSFGAMRMAARALGIKRSGHTGTLDPAASGVIVVLLGEATKLSGVLVHDDKVYDARVRLGVGTDTLDREGQVTETAEVASEHLEPQRIQELLSKMVGTVMQVPPVYSALKRDGRTLMSRARAGETVIVDARPVTCFSLELIGVEIEPEPVLKVRVHCGKGYYVRSLARDIGAALGVPAHLAGLRRLRVGPFAVTHGVAPTDASFDKVISISRLLDGWIQVSATESQMDDIRCGRVVPRAAIGVLASPPSADPDRALAVDFQGTPLALLRGEGPVWKVERGFIIDIPGCHD